MTNYLDVFQSRINHLGSTTAERIKNGGERSFYKWLAESPHTVRNLSIERGLYFDGIILTSKDKEYEKIMFLNVSNKIPLRVGDIMNWLSDSGDEEKWLLIQEERKVNGTYRTFWMVRCNYLIKWVDKEGHLQQSWSYFVSSLDSKIKGNYRTWYSMITPQPNKFAELLLPTYPIERSTNFIVEEESWSLIEYDHTSVPGVMYLSLTEGKINSIYDDVENNLADTDRLAKYGLLLPEEIQSFSVGEEIHPIFTLTKNGSPFAAETEIISTNKNIIAPGFNGILTAMGEGDCNLIIKLKDYPDIQQTITIHVGEQEQETVCYIEGPDSIKLDREATFTLVGANEPVIFTIEGNFAAINQKKTSGNQCVIKANNKNLLGNCVLNAEYDGHIYNKEISIIPLW